LIPETVERATLFAAIDQRRAKLQQTALDAAKELYRRRPKDFIRQLSEHWAGSG
jgi:hypothetical protein